MLTMITFSWSKSLKVTDFVLRTSRKRYSTKGHRYCTGAPQKRCTAPLEQEGSEFCCKLKVRSAAQLLKDTQAVSLASSQTCPPHPQLCQATFPLRACSLFVAVTNFPAIP